MASSTEPTSSSPDKYDQYLKDRITQTISQVKWIELLSYFLMLSVLLLSTLFVLCLVDAWIFELQVWMRWASLTVLAAGAIAFSIYKALPFLLWRVNPRYAARKLEEGRPELKNSVINYLTTEKGQGQADPSVLRKLSQTAARDVANIPLDVTVDRSPMIVAGYALAGIVAVFALYKVLSPKDPFQTIGRVILPSASLMAPARVRIADITPGDDQKYFGESVEISARIRGLKEGEFPQLLVTTESGTIKDQPLPMKRDSDSERFRIEIGKPDGLRESFTYRIQAGDALSVPYRIDVRTCPTVFLEKVDYLPPAYTGIPASTEKNPNLVSGVEGTIAKLSVRTNLPIETAYLRLFFVQSDQASTEESDSSGIGSAKGPLQQDPSEWKVAKSIKLESVDEFQAYAELPLELNGRRTQARYTHFQVVFTATDGSKSENEAVSRIQVIRDLNPEIEILSPKEKVVEIPQDRSERIEVSAVDPDHGLTSLSIVAEQKGNRLFEKVVFKSDTKLGIKGNHLGSFEFRPADYGLSEGDEIIWFGQAEDNRALGADQTLVPNRTRTENYKFVITAPLKNPSGSRNSDPEKKDPENQDPDKNPNPEQKEPEDNRKDKQGGKEDPANDQKPQNGKDAKSQPEKQSGKQSGKSQPNKDENRNDSSQKDGKSPQDDQSQKDGKSPRDDQSGNSKKSESGKSPRNDNQQNKSPSEKKGDQKQKGTPQESSGSKSGKSEKGAKGNQDSENPSQGTAGNDRKEKSSDPSNSRTSDQNDTSKSESGSERNSDSTAENSSDPGTEQGADSEPQGKPENSKEAFERLKKYFDEKENQESQSDDRNNPNNDHSNSQQQTPGKKNGDNDPENQSKSRKDPGKSDSDNGKKTPGKKNENDNEPGGKGKGSDKNADRKKENDPGSSKQGTENGKKKEPGKKSSGSDSAKNQSAEKKQPNDSSKSDDSAKKGGQKTDPENRNQSPDAGKKGDGKKSGNEKGNDPENSNQKNMPSDKNKNSEQGNKKGQGTNQDKGKADAKSKEGGKENSGDNNQQKSKTEDANQSSKNQSSGNKDDTNAKNQSQSDRSNVDDRQPQKNSGGDTGNVNQSSSQKSQDNGSRQKSSGSNQSRPETKADKANLDYTRKTTEMVLEKLADQKEKPDEKLLKDLNWTEEELQEFTRKWQAMKEKADGGSARDEKRFEDALKSLGLKDPDFDQGAAGLGNDDKSGYRQKSGTRKVPSDFARKFRAIQKSQRKLRNSN